MRNFVEEVVSLIVAAVTIGIIFLVNLAVNALLHDGQADWDHAVTLTIFVTLAYLLADSFRRSE